MRIRSLVSFSLLALAAFLATACGSRPDGVARQFYDSMVALDVDAMSEHVCEDERPLFRGTMSFFFESLSGLGTLRLDDFEARTERSDGTSTTLRISARVRESDRSDFPLYGRVRLLRTGSEWCITGERDAFRSIQESAEGIVIGTARHDASYRSVIESAGRTTVDTFEPQQRPDGPPPVQGEAVTTRSGLAYIDIETGTGAMPQPGQKLLVHYTMWLKASGEKIDTSRDGEPFEFVLGDGLVVEGFDEGLASMRVGGQRRLIVPPRLGYGDDDDYGDIPPNSTLIFDVDLVDVR
jgi:FKBP-type peptidyl-prolyl cis-trans isomerase